MKNDKIRFLEYKNKLKVKQLDCVDIIRKYNISTNSENKIVEEIWKNYLKSLKKLKTSQKL